MGRRRNIILGGCLVLSIAGMIGMSFAAVPLYRMFCQATGYNGTPKIGPAASPGVGETRMEVRFDANTNAGLPWSFSPDRATLSVVLGDEVVASYTAQNRATRAVTGIATYNIMPEKAAQYFHKTACFCFNEQTLQVGQKNSFPLSFWVDPAIAVDPDTRDVHVITLSYTFFRSLDDAARNGRLEQAAPHIGPRADAGPHLNLAANPP